MKKYEIWMEGYSATDEHSGAILLNDGCNGKPDLIEADNFDNAIEKYKKMNPNHGIEEYTRNNFINDEGFKNRRSNYKIWGCALFDNEIDARKSFG